MEVTAINARAKYIFFTSLFLIITIASIVLMIRYWKFIAELQQYGYGGIFLIAFIAGSSIPTPISYLLLTFTLGGILNPALVGIFGGLGAGIGGTLVYLAGRSGRNIVPGIKSYTVDEQVSNRLSARFIEWAKKKGSIVVFLMSAMLNPVFAPMAIALGAMKFRASKFFIMCVAGNMVKALVVAYAGYLGVGSLLRWLGGA